MSDIIYWEDYDKPIIYTDPITKKEIVKTGDYVCKDERVSKFWFYGSASANPSDNAMYIRAALLFLKKDGEEKPQRWESKEVSTHIDPNEAQRLIDDLINQAEQYLKNLK